MLASIESVTKVLWTHLLPFKKQFSNDFYFNFIQLILYVFCVVFVVIVVNSIAVCCTNVYVSHYVVWLNKKKKTNNIYLFIFDNNDANDLPIYFIYCWNCVCVCLRLKFAFGTLDFSSFAFFCFFSAIRKASFCVYDKCILVVWMCVWKLFRTIISTHCTF